MQKNTAAGRMVLRYAVLTAIAGALVFAFLKAPRLNQTTVALGFLVLVLITAYRWRWAYSLYASVLCTLLYNFFFLPPVGKLTIADPQNWVALATFLSASVLVSHLSDRERRLAESAEAARHDVELLYRLSQKLLVQDDVKELARSTPSIVATVFGFRAVALYVLATDGVFYSDPEEILIPSAELRGSEWSAEETVHTGAGFAMVPLRLGMQHPLGRLAISGNRLAPEMYEAIGSLVSVALERAAVVERSGRLEAARESERLRTALVDSVTHDLRTPLTAIRAAATTLQSQPLMEVAGRNELIAVVEEESARLDRLIGQAIEMAKLDSQSLRLELRTQDVRELLEMTVERMQNTLRRHRVQIYVADGMGAVSMDRVLMERVLQHLLENAASYSQAGEPIRLEAWLEPERAVFSVADRGAGIAAEELPFIFDKYYRGRPQKGSVQGTGMGLAIARAILKVHRGGISVESRPGQGARFTFWIPLGNAQG